MAMKVERNEVEAQEVAGAETAESKKVATTLRVYRKKSTFKGAGENDFWYSATRADGASVMCKFNCEIPEEIKILGAFEISDIVGNAKYKEVTIKGETFVNYTYYIRSCKFSEIPTESLPL